MFTFPIRLPIWNAVRPAVDGSPAFAAAVPGISRADWGREIMAPGVAQRFPVAGDRVV
jgi:hypothetical protein